MFTIVAPPGGGVAVVTCDVAQRPDGLLTDVKTRRGQQGDEGRHCPVLHYLTWQQEG